MNPWQILRLAPLLTDPKDRARVMGARVEACAFVVARRPRVALLVVRSQWGPWMPLQEGVRMSETLDQAFWRGLEEELGVSVDPEDRARLVDHRGDLYLGTVRLPKDRWDRGVRPVAPGAADNHPLALMKMRKKAYWATFRQVADAEAFALHPNGTEVVDAEWVPLAEARRRFVDTVPEAKRALLLRGLDKCEQMVSGTALHVPDWTP